jgi:hypothetical protein
MMIEALLLSCLACDMCGTSIMCFTTCAARVCCVCGVCMSHAACCRAGLTQDARRLPNSILVSLPLPAAAAAPVPAAAWHLLHVSVAMQRPAAASMTAARKLHSQHPL